MPDLARRLEDRQNIMTAFARRLLPDQCRWFMLDHMDAFVAAPGSGHNHQAWPGGYLDHLDELFGVAAVMHRALNDLRPLPFTLSEALLVLWLHDIEKPWKRLPDGCPRYRPYEQLAAEDPAGLQQRVCRDLDIQLTDEQRNALRYVHGELDDYRKDARVAGPLAAFCHNCDYWSARGWHDEPAATGPLPDMLRA